MEETFQLLYDTYHQDLYQFLFYMVKDKNQTEDLLQEVYIRVLNSYHTFEGRSSEKNMAFVYRTPCCDRLVP